MGFWSSVGDGLSKTAAGIYGTVDYVALGALPDFGAGSALPAGGFTTTNNLVANLVGGAGGAVNQAATQVSTVPVNLTTGLPQTAQQIGQTLPGLTSGLPQTGQNLGMGIGYLGQYGLQGIGAGAGSLIGDVGQGASKGFAMPLILIVGGAAVLLIILSRPGAANTIRATGSVVR